MTSTTIAHSPVATLADLPYWAVHKGKVARNPRTGRHAESNDPSTFGTRAEAETALKSGRYDGLGFLVDESLRITAVDLDHVIEEDGSLPEHIQALVSVADTYTELSPSGRGLHMIFGVADDVPRKNVAATPLCQKAEGYNSVRFMTFTGNRLPGTPKAFSSDIDTLRHVLDTLGLVARNPESPTPPQHKGSAGSQTNQDVLELAFRARNGDKIRRLWDGDTSDYPTHSEADAAFLSHMAFYTQDPAQLVSLLVESGLARKKTQRPDYVERTVQFVLNKHNGETYTPPTPQVTGRVTFEGERVDDSPQTPAPEFPTGIFPPAIDDYVRAASHSIRVPAEMVAVPMLVFAGSVIGNRLQITLKRGWNEFATLYAAVIADPGSAKTPALMAAQWPIRKLQTDAYEIYQRQRSEYDDDLQRWNDSPKDDRGPKPEAPTLHHVYSTDPTMEALVGILNQVQGVALVRDELMGWVASLDQYRKGGASSDKEQWLQLWSGAGIKSDRKGGGTIFAAFPVVGVYGGIQRDRARGLHDPDGRRDGWIERMLLFDPDVEPAGWTDDDLDPALLEPVVGAYKCLREIQKPDEGDRHSVQLSLDARRVWVDWYNANAEAVRNTQGLRRGFYSKMPSQVARIALILSSLWNVDDPRRMVSEARMQDAIDVGEWFRSHLDRVLPLIGDHSRGEPVGLSARILRILRIPDLQEGDGWVRRAQLIHKLGNVAAHDLTDTLRELQTRQVVESQIVQSGTRPAEEWRIYTRTSVEELEELEESPESGTFGRVSGDSSNSSNSSTGYVSQNGGTAPPPSANGKADIPKEHLRP